MFEIEFNNAQSLVPVDTIQLEDRLREALQRQGLTSATLSIALVDDATIHTVNRDHLQHDYPTDVISFLYEDDKCSLDGELVVSVETAIREAADYGWSPENELMLYLVHGLLHLCGFDDQTGQQREEMRAQERAILQCWGLSPHYDNGAASGAAELPE